MQDTSSLLVLHPALIFIIGGLLLSLTWGKVRSCLLVLTPLLSLLQFLTLGSDINISFQLLNYNISWLRIDGLSYVFTIAFHIAAIVAAIYSLHLKDKVQDVTGLLYMGGAIGACLAGDLFSLFVWWELTAISSVFLIWANRTEASYKAGLRYLLIQVCSGGFIGDRCHRLFSQQCRP